MKRLIILLSMIFLSASACQLGADPALATPTETVVVASSTPLPPTETPTPMPTATFTPTVTPNATATMIVRATSEAGPVLKELDDLLADTDVPYEKGHLAWQKKSALDITLTQPGGLYHEIAEGTKAANFILKSDVTWSTKGLIMCGVTFRSEKNIEQGAQYKFLYLRLSGAPGWEIDFFNFGKFKSNITGKTRFASALDLGNGAKNQFVLIAQDNKFTVYINGIRQGQFTDDSKLASDGYLAFLAYEDSGESTCSFENSWLWILDQ